MNEASELLPNSQVVNEEISRVWNYLTTELDPKTEHVKCLKGLKLSTEFWMSDESEEFLELLPDMKHLNGLFFDPKLRMRTRVPRNEGSS